MLDELAPPIAAIFDSQGNLETIIISDTDMELANATSHIKEGYSRCNIPQSVYRSGDVVELAKYVPADAIPHLVVTKDIIPPPDPALAQFQLIFQTYKDQLLALTDDTRLKLQAARISIDTRDVPSTLALFRGAANLSLSQEDQVLADTKVGDKDVQTALAVASAIQNAPIADKQTVALEETMAAWETIHSQSLS